MKTIKLLTLISLFTLSSSLYALPGTIVMDPESTRIAAKYAKKKAEIGALNKHVTQEDIARNTDGCDLNIGNLLIEPGVTDVPNDLIVIVDGDIIQANECRTH